MDNTGFGFDFSLSCIKFPIVLISSPRSGSTPLAYHLKNKYKIELFNETFSLHSINSNTESINEERIRLLALLKNNESKFILKIHLDDLKKYPDEIIKLIETHNCYLIRVRRKDLLKQCVSLYIESYRNIWGYYKNFIDKDKIDNLISTDIPLRYYKIKQCANRIVKINDELNSLPYVIDQDVWYEDLKFDDTFIITPKPKNYNDIQKNIELFLKNEKN